MANYSLTRFVGVKESSPDDALSALETHLETVDNTKTIHHIQILEIGPGKYWQAVALYDT